MRCGAVPSTYCRACPRSGLAATGDLGHVRNGTVCKYGAAYGSLGRLPTYLPTMGTVVPNRLPTHSTCLLTVSTYLQSLPTYRAYLPNLQCLPTYLQRPPTYGAYLLTEPTYLTCSACQPTYSTHLSIQPTRF